MNDTYEELEVPEPLTNDGEKELDEAGAESPCLEIEEDDE
jgi:hypothetical protein